MDYQIGGGSESCFGEHSHSQNESRNDSQNSSRRGTSSRFKSNFLSEFSKVIEVVGVGTGLATKGSTNLNENHMTHHRLTQGTSEKAPRSIHMLGVDISNLTMDEAVARIAATVKDKRKQSFAFVNADCLNQASHNAAYARVLSRQAAVFADGSGIRLAARMRGQHIRDNVNGTDMLPLLCSLAAREGHGIFLLGAREGLAEEVGRRMTADHPGLVISGTQHGYFPQADTQAIIDAINASGARILLVAMGVPQQEMWISRHLEKLNLNVVMGVGGLFDFYSGRIPRAPLWMRRGGLEWIYRLWQEPSRMWRRYIVGNPLFVWRAWREQRRMGARRLFPWRPRFTAARGLLRRASWRMQGSLYKSAKRLLDFSLAGMGLLVLTPFFLLIAAAIKLESPGPVFFSQRRVGLKGKRFRMWKFRSMYIDAEARRAALLAQSDRAGMHFKMKHDPRITRVGRIIRRASIDELPQLLNVLGGSMSIVGPRPNLESEVARYRIDEFGRLDCKPGITCIWQVSGRAEVPWERQVEMDLDYVYEPSLKQDINLIAKTLPAILSGKGAY